MAKGYSSSPPLKILRGLNPTEPPPPPPPLTNPMWWVVNGDKNRCSESPNFEVRQVYPRTKIFEDPNRVLPCIYFFKLISLLQEFKRRDDLRGYCTPDQFFDCLCIFLKNYNTLVRNISYLLPMCCSFWEKCINSQKTGLGCSTPLRGYCTPDQFFDCLCIFLKNYNTLVTSKICFL